MKALRFFFPLALIFSVSSLGDESRTRLLNPYHLTNDGRAPAPRLLVAEDGVPKLVKQNGPKLPNRVYGIFHTGEKAWVYALTEFDGEFPEPLELLYAGTVLPGSRIGAKNPFHNYKVTEEYRWVPTEETEEQILLIPSLPNTLKKITILTPAFDAREAQNWIRTHGGTR